MWCSLMKLYFNYSRDHKFLWLSAWQQCCLLCFFGIGHPLMNPQVELLFHLFHTVIEHLRCCVNLSLPTRAIGMNLYCRSRPQEKAGTSWTRSFGGGGGAVGGGVQGRGGSRGTSGVCVWCFCCIVGWELLQLPSPQHRFTDTTPFSRKFCKLLDSLE